MVRGGWLVLCVWLMNAVLILREQAGRALVDRYGALYRFITFELLRFLFLQTLEFPSILLDLISIWAFSLYHDFSLTGKETRQSSSLQTPGLVPSTSRPGIDAVCRFLFLLSKSHSLSLFLAPGHNSYTHLA